MINSAVVRIVMTVVMCLSLAIGTTIAFAEDSHQCDTCSAFSVFDQVTTGIRGAAKGARFVDFSVRCSDDAPKHSGAKVLKVIVAYDYQGKTLAARFNTEYRSSDGKVMWLFPLGEDWKKIHETAVPADVH